jgi:hypothetical protein
VAFLCLLVEVVGEVVSKYYSGVVEFESLGGVYEPTWFIPLGSCAQRFDSSSNLGFLLFLMEVVVRFYKKGVHYYF